MTFHLGEYLERTGMNPVDASPDLEGLQKLQLSQMKAIAFENIDVLSGRVPALDDGSVWQKLVGGKRGGYCLELNHLFGRALEAIGFQFQTVLGRVRMGAETGGARAHHAFVVTIDGVEWLADTGFGGPAPVLPVRLDTPDAQDSRGELFRIRQDHVSGEQVLERKTPDGWFPLYGFDRVPVTAPDLAGANFLCSRWDQSPFPNHLMMTIVNDSGRVNLFDCKAKFIGSDGTQEVGIASAQQLHTILNDSFHIEIDEPTLRHIWSRINPENANLAA